MDEDTGDTGDEEHAEDVPRRTIRVMGDEDIEGQPIVKYNWMNNEGVEDAVYMSVKTAVHMWTELGRSLQVLADAGWIEIEYDDPEEIDGEAA